MLMPYPGTPVPSSVVSVAKVALQAFPFTVTIQTPRGQMPLPIVMTAVAGAESSFVPTNRGDYGLRGPACNGYTSFGLWQVHLRSWGDVIARVSGIPATNPCGQAQWLDQPANCARMAKIILGSNPQAGLRNWSTWNSGAYLSHLDVAQAAVASLQKPSTSLTAAPGAVPTWVWVAAGSGAVLLGWGLLGGAA